MKQAIILSITVLVSIAGTVSAEIIRGIDIEFVTIGNAGNAGDTRQDLWGLPLAFPWGCGAVAYNYRIGKYEITNAQWNAFTTAAGAPTGNNGGYSCTSYWTGVQQPTNEVSWYEAAQFCNYLTSGDKSKGVYLFSGNNANPGSFMGVNRDTAKATYGTVYFLPTEDEWYKAAYFKPDASGYSTYANGLNTIPTADNGWNYYSGAYSDPWNVGTGALEQNGTKDMMGNVWEWNETLFPYSYRGFRGGSYYYTDIGGSLGTHNMQNNYSPDYEYVCIGFRVASSIPIPATLLLHSPNGSEVFVAGSSFPVTWSSTGSITNVLIEYSTNNGQSWNAVSPPNTGNTESYDWSVPMLASQECLIRISDTANSYVSDISDNVFEIVIPKTITVISPNGGESLISGAEQLIQWSSTGAISGILVEQSFNNGLNWFPVEPANIGNSGSHEWFVPFANSNECLVRLSDISNPAIYDISDSVFTIMQENPSEYPTLYEILRGSAPAIIESGRDFVHSQIPDSNSIAFILLENAGFANENIFGIYSAYKPHEKLQLFSGYDGPMDMVTVRFDSAEGTAQNLQTGQTAEIGNFFGFYLTTPQDGGKTFYTDASINPDSSEHGLIFNTTGFPGVLDGNPDSVIAFEDLFGLGDRDYNDIVVGITNAVPLPGSGPYCFKAIPGDLNNDCRVDLSDFAIIISHWLECNLDPQEACFGDSTIP